MHKDGRNRGNLVALGITVAVCLGAGALGGWFTSWSVSSWYPTLTKPAWTPPAAVFGPVWTILYVMMGWAAWLVWRARPASPLPLRLFAAQLALNVGWSALFFGLRSAGWALAEIALLLVVILATIRAFYSASRLAAALMVPYAIWVSYASALNYAIWLSN